MRDTGDNAVVAMSTEAVAVRVCTSTMVAAKCLSSAAPAGVSDSEGDHSEDGPPSALHPDSVRALHMEAETFSIQVDEDVPAATRDSWADEDDKAIGFALGDVSSIQQLIRQELEADDDDDDDDDEDFGGGSGDDAHLN